MVDENKMPDAVALKAEIDGLRSLIAWLSLSGVELACYRGSVWYPIVHANSVAIIAAAKNQATNRLNQLVNQLKAL